MKEKGADDIVDGADGSFGFAVLLRCKGAGKSEEGAMVCEEGVEFDIIKFFSIVALDGLNGEVEVCMNKGVESNKSDKYIRFLAKRKAPKVMRKIINNN